MYLYFFGTVFVLMGASWAIAKLLDRRTVDWEAVAKDLENDSRS